MIHAKSALEYARQSCDTLMRSFSPEALPPAGRFHYHQGVFLSGVYKTYALCGEQRYFDYLKAWVDSIIDPYGDISTFNPGQLDDLQPGVLLFPLLKHTGDARYLRAIQTIAYYIKAFARNPEGGFWHKAWYRNQMWLDGLYMAGPFAAQYGMEFDKPEYFELDLEQAQLMRDKTQDTASGLWYHAFDFDRQQPWADPQTGKSPEFWGRSIGWVPVALLEELDFFPQQHPGRAQLEDMTAGLLQAVLPYQDGDTGLWYQVVNKPGAPGNWVETSCTCLFVAALCKAVRTGVMGKECLAAARKGYEGVIARLQYNGDDQLIDNVCIGTGVGDYAHYCARPTSTNDLHGVGAFLLMCAEVQQIVT